MVAAAVGSDRTRYVAGSQRVREDTSAHTDAKAHASQTSEPKDRSGIARVERGIERAPAGLAHAFPGPKASGTAGCAQKMDQRIRSKSGSLAIVGPMRRADERFLCLPDLDT